MMNSKTAALMFALLSLGGMMIPGLSILPQAANAQVDIGGILEDAGVTTNDEEEEDDEEDEEDTTSQDISQPIDQEIDQEVDQEEENDQDNDNDQDQTGVIDQDIAQGIVDGDDKAKSKSESGDAKHKSSSSSSSGDAADVNAQDAANNAELVQDQDQTVDQD